MSWIGLIHIRTGDRDISQPPTNHLYPRRFIRTQRGIPWAPSKRPSNAASLLDFTNVPIGFGLIINIVGHHHDIISTFLDWRENVLNRHVKHVDAMTLLAPQLVFDWCNNTLLKQQQVTTHQRLLVSQLQRLTCWSWFFGVSQFLVMYSYNCTSKKSLQPKGVRITKRIMDIVNKYKAEISLIIIVTSGWLAWKFIIPSIIPGLSTIAAFITSNVMLAAIIGSFIALETIDKVKSTNHNRWTSLNPPGRSLGQTTPIPSCSPRWAKPKWDRSTVIPTNTPLEPRPFWFFDHCSSIACPTTTGLYPYLTVARLVIIRC